LFSNAIKFTKSGEVVLKVWTEQSPEKGPRLHFSIADTGTGIPKDKQEIIFEAFRQADGSTTREYGGTGLGLAICSRLVARMGGDLSVDSELGEGSRFSFSIPLRPAEAVPQPPSIGIDLAGLRVLVVDDNATNRRIVLEYLRRWGMSGDPADSGAAALAMLSDARERDQPYELVVVDAMMPQMDGFELCERIGEAAGLQPVLLMLSSLDLGVSSARCRKLGISQYVVKPVARDELRQAFCSALRLSRGEPVLAAATARLTSASAGLSILLAEDNAVNQLVAVRMLERQGHVVEVVSDGEQAVEALGRGKFDLVLMDVQMPNLDGLEATERIREIERHTGEHLPILALTAHALKGDREKCLAAGMDGYLTKPITSAALQKAILGLSREPRVLAS
jgi:CheY-like chemotaxis protein